ncbi:tetratricopeptide repeat protein [Paludibacter jiangxiensis]|uniref:Tetratricopeptide repeat-containing protein n=1 Tax=Paludibacter jiangxiensis TaxID=681398 RepID=A0A161LFL3_9BACT|nr:tetratricopeptide repeat protein [Paludibacter jiangxiensis]GAT63905.1 tetratricopeptide repeat-containing protein [Paludibacter jiangxiensis]
MKKLFLSVMLIAGFTCSAFAQKANVTKAKRDATADTPDFKSAVAAIEAALADPTTKDLAETWYTAGYVYNEMNSKEYKKELLKQPFDQEIAGSSIVKAFSYFQKAYDFDQKPNEKGKVKPQFSKDIKSFLQTYYTDGQLIRYGSNLFDKKDFAGVVKAFDTYLAIPDFPAFKANELKKDSTYKMVKYYAAIASINAGDTLGSIKRLESLMSDNYETKNVYELLYQQYFAKKDTVKYMTILKEGFDKYPAEPFFLQNLINNFIYSGKNKEALEYLNQAIAKEPNVAQYHFVSGRLKEESKDYEGAKAAFEKAIQLKPDYAEAENAIARMYYNKAAAILQESNDIKDMVVVKKKQDEAQGLFKESLPYFKKAYEMNPKDAELKGDLKRIYYRLQMNAEYEALNKE